MTVMRGVKVRSTDLTRLERLQTLVRDIAEGPVEIDVARSRFDALIQATHPYRRWVVTASLAGLAAAAAGLFLGSWLIMLLSLVSTAATDRVQHWLVYLDATVVAIGPVAASSLAALAAGLLSQVVSSRLRVPALALSMAAIVPLMPGLMVYRGVFEIVQRAPGEGLSTGLTTLLAASGIGMGLAAGVSMGRFLARSIGTELDRG